MRRATGILAMVVSLGWGLPMMANLSKPTTATVKIGEPQQTETISADELAQALLGKKAEKPLLLHVGFKVLYHSGHIPGSVYIGPASTREGMTALDRELKGLRHDRPIVLYCGCCPWANCPNIRPALRELCRLGYTNVRALSLPKDFWSDWAAKGLPVAKGN